MELSTLLGCTALSDLMPPPPHRLHWTLLQALELIRGMQGSLAPVSIKTGSGTHPSRGHVRNEVKLRPFFSSPGIVCLLHSGLRGILASTSVKGGSLTAEGPPGMRWSCAPFAFGACGCVER